MRTYVTLLCLVCGPACVAWSAEIVTQDGSRTTGVIVEDDGRWIKIVDLEGKEKAIAHAFVDKIDRAPLRPGNAKKFVEAVKRNAADKAKEEIAQLKRRLEYLEKQVSVLKSRLPKSAKKPPSSRKPKTTYLLGGDKDIDLAKKACTFCKGTGRRDCPHCVEGLDRNYEGNEEACDQCDGKGWRTCTFCDGSGKR